MKKRWLASACARLHDGHEPTRADVALLAAAWGNIGYAAGLGYLRHVGRRAASTRGPILECGSGATTLAIGALTKRSGRRVVVLEQHREWFEYMQSTLDHLGYDHVELTYAPLSDYGDYDWYTPPETLDVTGIGLVICDGPPGRIKGGRYGLMPVMGERLAEHCTILLDDTHRRAEKNIIDTWRRHRALTSNRIGRFGTHAEVTFR